MHFDTHNYCNVKKQINRVNIKVSMIFMVEINEFTSYKFTMPMRFLQRQRSFFGSLVFRQMKTEKRSFSEHKSFKILVLVDECISSA